ncbi:MAG: DUF2188 domain-containing protein [Actinomycetota bacterium]|nr:DUF2188 domain-containing protein [Actinomycetota bacterium]
MSAGGNVHVRERDGRWIVEREGRSDAVSEHVLQPDAIEAGRQLAAREGVQFLLHGAADARVTRREPVSHTPASEARSEDTGDVPSA